MKTKLVLISIITIFSLSNCQEKIVSKEEFINSKALNEMEKVDIRHTLTKQIEAGASSEYWVGIYGKEDLDALVSIEDTILKNNGYKTPEIDIFNQKIKTIFGRIIDNNSSNQYLKIDTYSYLKCDKELKFYPYSADAQYLYVDKKNNFITFFYALPQILDYVKLYPELSKYEEDDLIITDYIEKVDVRASQWKDDKDLSKQRKFNQQLLISRNKYLFNDDQSQFAWLINNDEYFMESLVTTFGYTEDKKLLKWVMEKNYKQAEDFLKNNVFVKDCQNKLEIREDILKYIEETITEQKTDYIEALSKYAYFLFNPYNDKETSIFNDKEKTKIFAYAANTYDQSFRKYSFLGTTNRGRWNMLGSYYYHGSSKEEWENFKKEMALNNYYNLPNLKSLIEYAEEFDGVGSPD